MTNVLRLPTATSADDIVDGTDASSSALEQETARREFETNHRDLVVALAENFDKPASTQSEICRPSKSVLRSFALVRMFDQPAFDAAIEKIRSAPPVKSFNIESFLRAIDSIARRLSSIEEEIEDDMVAAMSPTRRKEWQAAEAERIARKLKFIIHGTVGSNFCYSSDQSDLVFLSPREHNKNNLFNLAPKAYWEMNFGDYDGHKFVIDWDTVYSSLMMQAHQRGPVRMPVPRGRGAFEEDGSLVFNTGRELIFETGYRAPIHEHTASEFLYKRGVEIVVSNTPLDAARRKLMIDILGEFTWQARHHAVLLLGWIVMAIISGALPFRTMAWLTAVAGSGKSTLLQQIVRQVFSESTEGYFLGTTTIHGIASSIGNDSVPFIYDEAETGTERARERMTAFLTEIRGVISKSTAQRSVGSSDGSGRSTKLNATCLVASIADCIVDPADAQRVLRLKLQKPRFTNNEARQKAASFERRVAETFTPEFSADFYAFAILNYRALRNSIDAFTEYFFPIFEEPRPTKQFSSVLGCAFYFEFGRVPSDKAEIDKWCKSYGITKATLIDGDVVRDEHEVALEFLLQHRVSVIDGSNQNRPYTIAELLSAALRPGAAGEKIDRKIAVYQLEKNGIKIDFTNRWILLGRTHPGMRAIFARTTIGNNFVDAFADLVDERDREKRLNAVNFAGGVKSRALLIRLAKIEERIFADDVIDETVNTASANDMLDRLLALKIRCLNDEGRDSTHRIRDLINVVRGWGVYNGFVGREAANHALRSNGIYLGHGNALRQAACKPFIAIAKNHPTLIELLGRGGNAIGKNYADILAPISVGESENIDFAGIEKAGIIVLDPAYARLEQMSEELDLQHFRSADVLTAFVSENKPSNPVH